MPFPEGTAPALKALYGVIERATAERVSTTELWARIREARPPGVSLGRNAAAQVSTLRGYAAANRNAADRLSRLKDNEGITGREIHTPIWSGRDPNARAAAPKIAARVQLMVHSTDALDEESGGPALVPKWVTLHFDQLPATAGQLRDTITQAVSTGTMANGSRFGPYPDVVGDIGRIELLSL